MWIRVPGILPDRHRGSAQPPFPWLQSFAGTIEYTRTVDVEDPAAYHTLDAGLTHNGITELFVNGEPRAYAGTVHVRST